MLDEFNGFIDGDISVEGEHIESHKLVIGSKFNTLKLIEKRCKVLEKGLCMANKGLKI